MICGFMIILVFLAQIIIFWTWTLVYFHCSVDSWIHDHLVFCFVLGGFFNFYFYFFSDILIYYLWSLVYCHCNVGCWICDLWIHDHLLIFLAQILVYWLWFLVYCHYNVGNEIHDLWIHDHRAIFFSTGLSLLVVVLGLLSLQCG